MPSYCGAVLSWRALLIGPCPTNLPICPYDFNGRRHFSIFPPDQVIRMSHSACSKFPLRRATAARSG